MPEAAWGLRVMFRGLVSDLAWNGRRGQIPTCHWYPEGRWAVALLSALPSFSASFYFLSCLAILPPFLQLTGCGPLGRWTQNCPALVRLSGRFTTCPGQPADRQAAAAGSCVEEKEEAWQSPDPHPHPRPTRDGELQEVLWWPFGGPSPGCTPSSLPPAAHPHPSCQRGYRQGAWATLRGPVSVFQIRREGAEVGGELRIPFELQSRLPARICLPKQQPWRRGLCCLSRGGGEDATEPTLGPPRGGFCFSVGRQLARAVGSFFKGSMDIKFSSCVEEPSGQSRALLAVGRCSHSPFCQVLPLEGLIGNGLCAGFLLPLGLLLWPVASLSFPPPLRLRHFHTSPPGLQLVPRRSTQASFTQEVLLKPPSLGDIVGAAEPSPALETWLPSSPLFGPEA